MIKTINSIEVSEGLQTTGRRSRGARLARIAALGLLVGGLAALGAVATAAPPISAAQCVTFDGLRHCSVGAATLNVAPGGDRLEVRNPGQSISAGVTIAFPDVTGWTGGMRPQYAAGSTPVLRASSLSDGVVTSRSEVTEVGNRAVFSASYTGSEKDRKYTAMIYRSGVLVGSFAHIPDDEPAVHASVGWKLKLDQCSFVVARTGSCEWIYTFSSGESFELPDGQVVIGDTLRLVEEVNPSGAYPYLTFDGLIFQGNFVQNDLEDESVAN